MNRLIIEPSLFNRYYDDKIQKIVRDFKNNSEISSNYFPAVDVIEKDNSINIVVELPGVKKEEVKIVLENGILTINGGKKNYVGDKDAAKVYRSERKFGKFERGFKLRENINPDNVKAKFENGVLTVSVGLLVPEAPKEKVIEIN
jgi:HSP20 family protein